MEREPIVGDIVTTPIGKGILIGKLHSRPEVAVKFKTRKGFQVCSFGIDSVKLWKEEDDTIPVEKNNQ